MCQLFILYLCAKLTDFFTEKAVSVEYIHLCRICTKSLIQDGADDNFTFWKIAYLSDSANMTYWCAVTLQVILLILWWCWLHSFSVGNIYSFVIVDLSHSKIAKVLCSSLRCLLQQKMCGWHSIRMEWLSILNSFAATAQLLFKNRCY